VVTPGGTALSDSEKVVALADNLVAQFQPVIDPPDLAVIQTVDFVLRAYSYAPLSEPTLTNPIEAHESIRGLIVGKAPGPNGITNRALKHLSQHAILFLVTLFNASFHPQHFALVWQHARLIFHAATWEGPGITLALAPDMSFRLYWLGF
jgi:hypothetical protein